MSADQTLIVLCFVIIVLFLVLVSAGLSKSVRRARRRR